MRPTITRNPTLDTREGLLTELDAIDDEGWDSARGERLLTYVRTHMVRPQVETSGLRGPAAKQADATGWAVAWETLTSTSLRTARSPWGVLWVAVRRAVHGERLMGTYLGSPRHSWHAEKARLAQRDAGLPRSFDRPISLSLLLEEGWEPVAEPWTCTGLGRRLEAVIEALIGVGWERRAAHAVVEGVALTAVRDGKESVEAQGWRPLASRLGLPPWQVRRVTVLLLGAPGWQGVVERMATEGCQVLEDESILAALRSTALSSWPPPPAAARKAMHRPAQEAVPLAS
jgi:hypothetical protein